MEPYNDWRNPRVWLVVGISAIAAFLAGALLEFVDFRPSSEGTYALLGGLKIMCVMAAAAITYYFLWKRYTRSSHYNSRYGAPK